MERGFLQQRTGNYASMLRGVEKLAPSRHSQLMSFPNYEEVTLLDKSHILLTPRDSSPPSRNWKLNILVKYTVQYYVTALVIKLL